MLNWTHCDTVSKFPSFPTSFAAYLWLDCAMVLPIPPAESQEMCFPTPLRRTGEKGEGKGKLEPPNHPVPLKVSKQWGQKQARWREPFPLALSSMLSYELSGHGIGSRHSTWWHSILTFHLTHHSTQEQEQEGWRCLQLLVPSWDCDSWGRKQPLVDREPSRFSRQKPCMATKAQAV